MYYYKNLCAIAVIALGVGILTSFFLPSLVLVGIVTIILIAIGICILKI
ncbi:MAG: hypothetical protein Q8865_07080 [Bacillota bacterium]|nr:hypothetical protein [Bacillota bacterium]